MSGSREIIENSLIIPYLQIRNLLMKNVEMRKR